MSQPNKTKNASGDFPVLNIPTSSITSSSITWSGTCLGCAGNGGLDTKQTILINTLPHVKQIIFSNPMTTVIWADDTKTQVECKHGDVFDESVGFALCVTKKLYGRELYTRLMKRAKRQY